MRMKGKISVAVLVLLGVWTAFADADIVIDTKACRLVIGADAVPKSLVAHETGEECLCPDSTVPFFAVVQERPFNNEVKLIHPDKRTVYPANRVRRAGDRLIVGFEVAPYEAEVSVREADGYIAFRLERFLVEKEDYGGLAMDLPPVSEFRFAQLPVRNRTNFGDWLNVMWDDRTACAVIGTDEFALVDSERRAGCRVMMAMADGRVRLEGTSAAIVVGAKDRFLDRVEAVENDFGLPKGVASRRNPIIGGAIYMPGDLAPDNVDEHIAIAKAGGFTKMRIYYSSIFRDGPTGQDFYKGLGDYNWKTNLYPNREADLKAVLDRIRAAGLTPGLHVLQPHIGFLSDYVTPRADPRLRLKRHFTLLKATGPDDREIVVAENPRGAARCEGCRLLRFGEEIVGYADYTTEPPYRFTGLTRGALGTIPAAHERGCGGGVLDVSAYAAHSFYLDQTTDLQDEIAGKIARIYDLGFSFFYFDGSEGVNVPYGHYVAQSQYRVWRKVAKEPVFGSGAAKSHFGWHMLAGANGFDRFPEKVFKEKILEFPVTAAALMAKEFTCVNFGWWSVGFSKPDNLGLQPDDIEFGVSRAVAWDCPIDMGVDRKAYREVPYVRDVLESVRRWEDVRAKGWLTPERKAHLRTCRGDHHLYLDERGGYELYETEMLPTPDGAKHLRGFVFERGGKRVVACWHTAGEGTLDWSLGPKGTLSNLKYVTTDLSRADVRAAWLSAKLTDE